MTTTILNTLSTKDKALALNLNKKIYGSFAEIGAGQEVAANFFKAGGASGTIAKTMSAYDMAFSDAIYGSSKSKRYVCEERLVNMFDHEFQLLEERLGEKKGDNCQFFAFANTIEALNFHKSNEGHGWLGIRFQTEPNGPYNDAIIHVLLKDNDYLLQQQAVGIVGVNLIYGSIVFNQDPDALLLSLMDNLSSERIGIDMIRLIGPAFEKVDSRLMSLSLVKYGFSDIALFGPDGKNLQPSDALYKKNILVLRGRFRPLVDVHLDMLENGKMQFESEPDVDKENMEVITELTLQSLSQTEESTHIDQKDFLDRVDILCSQGLTVMISNYHEYYKLVSYLSTRTKKKIGLVIGYPNLEYIFNEDKYKDLPGGILESFATLFSKKVKLFVYPTLRDGEVLTGQKYSPATHLEHLFKYLLANDKIEDIKHYKKENLHVDTNDLISLIIRGEDGWEKHVKKEVVEIIKDRCLFGYPCVVIPKANNPS